jgi:hypothetical protein
MARLWTPTILILTLAAAGCKEASIPEATDQLPNAELSTQYIDYGEVDWGTTLSKDIVIKNSGKLAMGIGSITLGANEMEGNFTVNWSSLDLSCGEDAEDSDLEDSDEAEEDAGDPSGRISLDEESDEDNNLSGSGQVTVVRPGCALTAHVALTPTSVGPIHGSVLFELVTDDADEPEFYRDPDTFRHVVLLKATGLKGAGNIVVSPRTLDFGHPAIGEEQIRYVRIHNVGSGELTVDPPEIENGCDEDFEIDLSEISEGITLAAKTSTLIPVRYLPSSSSESECELRIASNDVDMPILKVTIKGKEGTKPGCTPPSVIVLDPPPGTIHSSHDDLTLTLKISDQDEPATELRCTVYSTISLEGDDIADCAPYSESGYTEVTIPAASLLDGVDVLEVKVKDECSNETFASTSILVRVSHSANDDDGDGFDELNPDHTDCDDTDPLTYPGATEIHDDKDNDCDGEVDESTDGSDDDGDGMTEAEGDCNDYDYDTYPGAPELSDQVDNNCDGTVDEGTSLYDDDGDGFAEVDNDCDDTNPDISPAATEYCDGLDNNCNGLKDSRDGCVEIEAKPMIIGGIQMDTTALGPGESTIMTVTVFDPDGVIPIYAWQQDDTLTERGHDGFDNTATQTVTWTAPQTVENKEGEVFNIYVRVSDKENNQDLAFANVTVYPEPVRQTLSYSSSSEDDEESGCGSDESAQSLALPGLLGLLALGLRRREDD